MGKEIFLSARRFDLFWHAIMDGDCDDLFLEVSEGFGDLKGPSRCLEKNFHFFFFGIFLEISFLRF